jgi:hypothetical protein
MRAYRYRSIWLIVFLVFASLGCRLVSGIGETKATLEAAATQAKEGITILGTGQAILTEVGDSALLETAQALLTEGFDSGLIGTAIAAATQEGPSMVETAKALATQTGPRLQETAQASMGEPPEDIPIIPGTKDDHLTSEFMVSYSVEMPFSEVVDYYKREMPNNGWIIVDQTSIESEYVAVLNYKKGDRNATVTINLNPVNNQTDVIILIANN